MKLSIFLDKIIVLPNLVLFLVAAFLSSETGKRMSRLIYYITSDVGFF